MTGVLLTLSALGFSGGALNEFDLSTRNIPLEEILSGGPPKDGIPAISDPVFVAARDVTFLDEQDRILGLHRGRETRAYPIKILNWHEIVNDTIDGKPVVITFCPLCGTGIGFDAVIEGRSGVSGLLYQIDLLMYDHKTESLWSQVAMEALTGPMTGTTLRHLFLEHTTWGEWRRAHPDTRVLSSETGYVRDYNRDPYLSYAQRADLMFPTAHRDSRYHPKEWVLGLDVNGTFKAYPFTELQKVAGPVRDEVNGQDVVVHFNSEAQSASVSDATGRPIPSIMAYWFAWYAFHPDTLVLQAGS